MRSLLLLIFLLITFQVFADDQLTVSLEPKKPIVNETFSLIFKVISSEAKSIEEIDFKSPGLTIVGQSQQGISTRTVYANGKLTVTRELTVLYELQAANYGMKFIRDIKVKVDGKVLSHPMVSFEVMKEPQVAPDVFVMADVAKTDVFVGEGIVARYYLYSKASVSNLDVKKYPKLNNFLKRYLQEPDRSERVSVDGQIYIRNLIYAAKLFPEKPGSLKIDPLSLSVTYSRTNLNDPFAFTNPRDLKTRTISSDTINLNVLPLPTPVPSNFTGLVGKHQFSLRMNQNKLVVNQPLELVLSVSGPGALENFEAPKMIENKALEEFESNGELKIQDTDFATKIFTYTYLAAAPLELPSQKMKFSYLNPTTAQYEEVEVEREAVHVGGQARNQSVPKTENNKVEVKDRKTEDQPAIVEIKGLSSVFSWKKWQDAINLGLCVLAVVILLSFSTGRIISLRTGKAIVPSHFKKDFNYHDFVQWLSPVMVNKAKSPKEVLREMGLSSEAQKYFEELLYSSDVSKFSSNKKDYNYSFKAKYFKELASKIEKFNESHT